jgi:hypothetical protein
MWPEKFRFWDTPCHQTAQQTHLSDDKAPFQVYCRNTGHRKAQMCSNDHGVHTTKNCDMPLTLDPFNSGGGVGARVARHVIMVEVIQTLLTRLFPWLLQRPRSTGNVTPTPLINADRPRNIRTPANENANCGESHVISRENSDYPCQRSAAVLRDGGFRSYHYSRGHFRFHAVVFYRYSFAKSYINTLQVPLHNYL